MRVVVLVALIGCMAAARSFTAEDGLYVGSSSALAVGYLLLSAFFMGSLLKSLNLPRLTGYLLAGMLAGASLLDLIPHEALDNLSVFTGVAVSLIALTAGTELDLRPMRPLMKAIGWVTLLAVVGGAIGLGLFIFAISPWLPFLSELALVPRFAFAMTLGVVLSAQSPAVVVALRTELAADGPLVRTVLGIVVIADLVVILLFTLASAIAKSTLGAGESFGLLAAHISWELLGSVAFGVGIGVVLAVYLRRVPGPAGLFVLMLAFIVAEVGRRASLDPLLLFLSAGVTIRNATAQGDRLHHAIEGAALPVYLVFFAVAGATIHLDVLAVLGLPALAIVLTRAGLFVAGARVGARIAAAPEVVRRFAGFGLLPQAGLALALAMSMQSAFGELGAQAAMLALGVVALNELLAPVAYRWAIVRAGEAGAATAEAMHTTETTRAAEPTRAAEASPFAPFAEGDPWPTAVVSGDTAPLDVAVRATPSQ